MKITNRQYDMKKLLISLTALLGMHSYALQAASVGPYTIDAAATASSITSASNMATSTGNGSAITDFDVTTFVSGNPLGSIGLGFDNALFNQTGDDLAFYFVRAAGEPDTVDFGLDINGTTNNYAASLFTYVDPADGITKKYQIDFGSGYADMFIATVELGDFFVTGTDSISALTMTNLNSTDRLALAAGFNLTAASPVVVPLPAAAWLFITGLGALGVISRRRVKH